MKTLTFPIQSGHFINKLIKREGNVILTEQISRETNNTVGYEIMIIRTRKKTGSFNGKVMFEKGDEHLPTSNQWGKFGWTKSNLPAAEKKFQEVIQQMTPS